MQQTLLTTKAVSEFDEEAVLALSEINSEPNWMRQSRLSALRAFHDIPRPTTRDEPWRRTDIRRLDLAKVVPSTGGARLEQLPARLTDMIGLDEQAGLLLHADGGNVHSSLDASLAEQGVVFCAMDTAVHDHSVLLQKHFMKDAVSVSDGYFSAMHAAMWSGGTFLYVPKDVVVELPLRAATWAGPYANSFTHTLVVVERGAKVTLIEEFASDDGADQAMHNGVVELIVRDNAQLDYVNVQDWSQRAFNFTTERAIVHRDAALHWVVGGMGSRLTKSFIDTALVGPGSTALMSGVFFGDGRQHLDFDTQQNHMAPNTTSDLLYKGALRGRAHSVWQGMIKVFPDAQKTDGYQANRNLILEKTARADSIPGLEIEADDVRCTHGATISQLDPEEVFYIRSRGLPFKETQRLIVQGFFTPVIDRIPLPDVRERLTDDIIKKIG
jgi:Fe-S cluster assembly protein SufD